MIKTKVEALATDAIQEPVLLRTAVIIQDVKAVIDVIPDKDRHQVIADRRGEIGNVGDVEIHTIQTHADTKS